MPPAPCSSERKLIVVFFPIPMDAEATALIHVLQAENLRLAEQLMYSTETIKEMRRTCMLYDGCTSIIEPCHNCDRMAFSDLGYDSNYGICCIRCDECDSQRTYCPTCFKKLFNVSDLYDPDEFEVFQPCHKHRGARKN